MLFNINKLNLIMIKIKKSIIDEDHASNTKIKTPRHKTYNILESESKETKNYETWKGYNFFFCNGKIYSGPGFGWGLLTSLYILVYSLIGLFFIFMVWYFNIYNLNEI